MEKLNQVFTKEGIQKIWKHYKFLFLFIFACVSLVGVLLSIPKQKNSYTTNMEIMLSINSTLESSTESERESVIGTYKDYLVSKGAVSGAESALKKASLNAEGVFESLTLSQNANSQFLDLKISRMNQDEGEIIGKVLNDFAEKYVKESYPDKNIAVQYHFFQSNSKQAFNVKLTLAAIIIGFFMGVIALIIIDVFSSRILNTATVEAHGVKVFGKIKSE
ncbi:hypothetical protein [Enterococcus dongliensis]|uniref:hypothetical protein n=1 Tax=Enterococcus dongliensis TaxID=2559925 RepID=UPI00288F9B35|nr:hypothetical protein [Enterococcus dongliensis]MDT2702011.1 hypothetical protein [Enterococcus dongliensis]